MMRPAPAMRAPWITDWPTPPQPRTATLAPGFTCAVLSAAPTPVVTPQPIRASCVSGRSVSTFTSDASLAVITLEKVPRPVMQKYGLPSGRLPRIAIDTSFSSSQSSDSSCRQCQQAPQAGTNEATTRSPFFTRETSAPTSTTRPAPSWPSTMPGGKGT